MERREGQMEQRESPLKRMTAVKKREEKIPTAAHNAIAGVKC